MDHHGTTSSRVFDVVLTPDVLVTVRHADPLAFRTFEATFCRLKDFRRVATRGARPRAGLWPDPGDKLALNFLSAITLAAITVFWC